MNPVVIDYETFYSDDYTLSKSTTESYIRDRRFKAHGAAIKWSPNHNAKWYDEKELRYVLAEHDWSDTFLICWHYQFDGLILNHHYDVRPKMANCPMSMARLLLGSHVSVALDSIRKQFGFAPKTTPYGLFKGKHWNEMTPDVQQQVADGARDEVESIWKLFCLFAKNFPAEEYDVLNAVLRMFTEPMLRADVELLALIWEREAAGKDIRAKALGIAESELQSADKFVALLEAEGVEIEYKNGKNGPIPAIAKNDDFMRKLLEDENDRIRGLAEARIGAKSTLMQTRAETMGWMAQRRSGFTDGKIPFYLRYSGAGTLRPSGGDKFNALNFKRNSDLRRSIVAPEGHLLAPIDSSQIEFRVAHYLAGGPDAPPLRKLARGEDPYADLASLFYNERIYKPAHDDPRKAEMEAKRGCGKQGHLMCIYGAAAPKYKATAKAGLYGPSVDLTMEESERHVTICRDQMPWMCAKNTGYWAQAGRMLARLAGGDEMQWGPLTVKDHKLILPSGIAMLYDTLEYHHPDETENVREFEMGGYWRVKTRHGWKKMWGSKLVQNICEGVSRVIVSQAMVRITRMGYRVLNWPYDELLVPIPKDGKEQWHVERCVAEMKREVPWLPGLPLDCDVHIGERYSK
jgi:hypothetical protein